MKYPFALCVLTASFSLITASALHAQTAEPAASATPTPTAAATVDASGLKPRDIQPPHDRKPVSGKMLEKYDTNKNGVIDPEEKEAMKKDRAALREERLKKYDKNGDGKLDDTEKAAMKEDLKANRKGNKPQ